MEFFYNKKRICLKGTNKSMTHWLDARKQIKKIDTVGGELMMMSIYPNTGLQLMSMKEVDQTDTKVDPKIQEVLDKYAEVFVVPNKLPLVRSNDHRIPLMPGTQPVNIRPYRHPHVQKDAIEAMALMNDVFREYLRNFTLVFLDDILIYSKSLKDHVIHLMVVLAKMKDHTLYAKESKYVFGTTHLEYLVHVILAAGVATDLSKMQAMQSWTIPNNIKKLRGFLGLTGYYRRFIENFASIREHPKGWFKWIPLAELWYNLNYHLAIDTTPFEALYGRSPPVHVPYIRGLSKVDVVDRSLIAREQAIKVMKFHLSRAQNRMKQQADKNRSEKKFEVGN
uniref:Reverse transcriptase domain-containing protein n=1 Tax=Tanacetum cinerariifolium TaxID=118510 RepID=A0A6L2NAG9_TANCI|nr:hypothetical protein [Tanacetum cinerariifolium]